MCGEGRDLLMIQSIQASVKHGGRSVMAWACMAASGVDSLIFIYVTHDGSSRMKSTKTFYLPTYGEMHPN